MASPSTGRVEAFYARLGKLTVQFRWLMIALWLVAAVLSAKALPSLGSEINNNNSQFLPASAPSSQAENLADPLFGNANTISQIAVVAARPGSKLTADDLAALAREADALRAIPKVESVRLLGISHDGVAAQLLVNARVNQADVNTQKTLVNEIHRSFASVDAPPGLEFHTGGEIAVNVANQSSSQKTGSRVQGISAILIIILLLLIFRSVLAPVITLFPPIIALVIAERCIGGLGAHGLKISEITELLLIVLILGAGTDYGLFLVFRVREEMRAGRSNHEAVAHSLERVGESISASGATVIIALLTLLFASFGIYKDLGIPLAIGVAVMLLAGLTLLPALLAVFGRAAFWPSKIVVDDHSPGFWSGTTTRLLAHPVRTLTIGVVVLGALACAALGYVSGGFGGAVNAPSGTDAAQGNALLSAHFPAVNNPTNLIFKFDSPIWEHPQTVDAIEASLKESDKFSSLVGPLNVVGTPLTASQYAQLHHELGPPGELPAKQPADVDVPPEIYDAYRASAIFVSEDGRTFQFEANLRAGNAQSNAAIDAIPAVRDVVTHTAMATGAADSGVAGTAPALYDVASTSNGDLVHIIPIVILAIGLLLGLVLRSVIAPLYLIVSVGLSYFAALGLSVIVFIYIGGESGLTFILPFLMFIFLLALGEDYNILVMTRIREEARRLPLREAVIQAVSRTGTTITSAGVVLAGTFAVFAFAGSSGPGGAQIRAIGFGLAIGVLMDTFVVRTLLVPATVMLLGRWNWWPSQLTHEDEPEPELETVSAVGP